jgi:ParB-like chromosome segregation protein Spo0J
MEDAHSTICTVPLSELGLKLSALRLCQPAADENMRRSLERHGQLTTVAAFVDGECLQLVDGFKRLRAGRRLGWTSLRVCTLAFDETTATALISALHEQRGLTELEEGWLVHSLCREHGLSQGVVAQLLGRHKSWVSRRLLLVEGLEGAVQGDVRLGLLSPRSALAVAALPRGNQRRVAELVMERGMTTRQAETLVRRLCELDSDQARDALMDGWPESTAAPMAKTRPRSEREQLLADVTTLMRIGVRLEVRLLDAPVDTSQTGVLREALTELAALVDTLGKALQRALAAQDKVDATLAKS